MSLILNGEEKFNFEERKEKIKFLKNKINIENFEEKEKFKIPQEIEKEKFENEILKRINNEDDRKLVLKYYKYREEKKSYILKNNISLNIEKIICEKLKAIDFNFNIYSISEKNKKIENDSKLIKKYYEDQKQICLRSSLYGDSKCENAGKVLMLFSEVYPLLIDCYGIHIINPDTIINFENSNIFTNWFARVKYILGIKVHCDPDFYQIGKWMGKGFVLKYALSIIYYSDELKFDELIIQKIINRQKKLLDTLLQDNYFIENEEKAIDLFDDGYYLLNEKTILSYKKDLFFNENIIK